MPRGLRTAVALLALTIVLFYSMSAVGRYRAARQEEGASSLPATSTAAAAAGADKPAESDEKPEGESSEEKPPADEEKAEGPTVTVKVDGLNFRREPDKNADVIRGLDQGEELTLIKTEKGWHYAEDGDGERGWLYASEQYSTVEE